MADIRIVPALGAINVTGSADFRGDSASTVLFVSGSGNVGVGTSNPISKLHVAGAVKATAVTGNLLGTSTDTGRAISILNSGLAHGESYAMTLGFANSSNNQAEITYNLVATGSTSNRLSLGLYNSANTLNILGTGNIGVGITAPKTQLHLNAGGAFNNTDANNRLFIERDSHTYILFSSPNEFDQGFHFHNTADNASVGRIAYQHRAAGDFLTFNVAASERLSISSTGQIKFNTYGSGTFTGTAARTLAVDSSGNVIEISNTSLGGSGTANRVAYWTDSNTLAADADFFFNGTNVGIGNTNPGARLDVNSTTSLISNFTSQVADGVSYIRLNNSQQTTSEGSSPAAIELVGLRGTSTHGRHAWIGAEGVAATTFRTQIKFKIRPEDSAYEWSTLPTQMVIDGNGSVGIGTATPSSRLHVLGASATIDVDDPSAGNPGFRIMSGGSTQAALTSNTFNGNTLLNIPAGTLTLQAGQTSITGDLTVNGKITAREFHTTFVSASIIYQSGSTQFGNSDDDNHAFTGRVIISGSTSASPAGQLNVYAGGGAWSEGIIVNPNSGGTGAIFFRATRDTVTSTWFVGQNGIEGFNIIKNGLTGSTGFRVDLAQQIKNTGETVFGFGVTAPSFTGSLQGNITGNAATATALQTARTITIGSTGKTFDGTGNVSWTLGEIGAQAAGSYLTAEADTLQTVTTRGSDTTTGMTIAGNVGIGTTAPTRRLHVRSTDGTRGIMVEQTLASDYAEVHFSASREYRIGTGGSTSDTEAANNWYVYDATAAAQRLVITSVGNVGIGSSSPVSRLQVAGASGQGNGVLNISNTYAAGGVYFPAAKFKNTRGDHSFGIISEFSIGSVGSTDRSSILFYSDAAVHSWQVGQVTSPWGTVDSFGIGYRASNTPSTFSNWPTNYFNITPTGDVGIGTGSPSNRLQVAGGVTATSFTGSLQGNITGTAASETLQTVTTRGAATTTGMTIAGSVGIGTTAPANLLSIGGQSHTSPDNTNRILNFYLVGSELHNSVIPAVVGNNNNGTTQPEMVGLSLFNRSTTNNTWSPMITFGGLSTSGNYMNGAAGIAAQLPANTDDSNFRGGNLVLYTAGTSNGQRGLLERMRITSAGNVGIGTTNPTLGKVVIEKGGSQFPGLCINNTTSDEATIRFKSTHDANSDYKIGASILVGSAFEIFSVAAAASRLVITSAGNVGIGNTVPLTRLHISDVGANIVSGNAIISSTMKGLIVQNTNNGDESIGMWFNTGGSHWSGISGQRTAAATTWLTDLRFFTHEAATVDLTFARERMRIDGEGNVGIGNTNPAYKLDVSGTIRGTGLINTGTSTLASQVVIAGNTNSSNTSMYDAYVDGGSSYFQAPPLLVRMDSSATGGIDEAPVALFIHNEDGTNNTWTKISLGAREAAGAGNSVSIAGIAAQKTSGTANAWASGDLHLWTKSGPTQVTNMVLKSNGNVGIGTDNPGSLLQVGNAGAAPTGLATLTLTGANTAPQIATKPGLYHRHAVGLGIFSDYAMSFQVNGSTSLADAMFIMNTGNVGIGTSGPGAKLDIVNENAAVLTLQNTENDYGANQQRIDFYGKWWSGLPNEMSFHARIAGEHAGGNGYHRGNLKFYTSADTVLTDAMTIQFNGNVGIGTATPAARLEVVGDTHLRTQVFTDTVRPYTGDQLSLLAGGNNRLYVNGSVGIGTTTPSMKFDLISDTSYAARIEQTINNTGTDYNDALFLGSSFASDTNLVSIGLAVTGTDGFHHRASIKAKRDGSIGGQLAFFIREAGTASHLERVTIRTTGNVGIGTTSPSAKLEVSGNLHLGGSDTSNFIAFRGTTGDGPSAFSHTFIGERIYDVGEGSELFLAKLNDNTGGSNPDRIRMGAAELLFQTYTTNLSTTQNFEQVATNADFQTRMIVKADGNVGIGSVSPAFKLDVSGAIRATGDVLAFSDARVKENIVTLENSLDLVTRLRGVRYNRIGESQNKIGVIAQEVLEVLPEVVQQDQDGNYSVAYGNLAGLFIESIKQHQQKIQTLEDRISVLEKLLGVKL